MAALSTTPQITDTSSPLEALVLRALRRYGEMSPSTKDAETILMFMDYANSILDDVMAHPYWQKGVVIPYYSHHTERRPVPDTVVLSGLIALYSVDQTSAKAKSYLADYYNRLNQVLSRVKFGVGAQFEMQATDYGAYDVENRGVT